MVTLKTIALSCAAAAAMVVSVPVVAGQKTKVVRYHDLDLSTANDQQRLHTRVKSAVKQVCNSPAAFSLAEKRDLARCKKDALAKAIPKVERTIARYQENKSLAANDPALIVGN